MCRLYRWAFLGLGHSPTSSLNPWGSGIRSRCYTDTLQCHWCMVCNLFQPPGGEEGKAEKARSGDKLKFSVQSLSDICWTRVQKDSRKHLLAAGSNIHCTETSESVSPKCYSRKMEGTCCRPKGGTIAWVQHMFHMQKVLRFNLWQLQWRGSDSRWWARSPSEALESFPQSE